MRNFIILTALFSVPPFIFVTISFLWGAQAFMFEGFRTLMAALGF